MFGAALGAVIGSFLATVLIRWPEGRSAVRGLSHCDRCGERLRAAELVPLISFLWARGRCRRCGGTIDPRHIGMEGAGALVGAVAFAADFGMFGMISAILGWWLLLAAALDAEHHWLPDRLTVPLIPAGLLVALLGSGPDIGERLIGALAGFLVLAAIAVVYRRLRGREGLGGGDPKLLAGIGAWLGWQQLPFVLLGAGVVGLGAVLLLRIAGRPFATTDRLPLGSLMIVVAWPLWLLNGG